MACLRVVASEGEGSGMLSEDRENGWAGSRVDGGECRRMDGA